MTTPLVSVIIPAYNAQLYIEQCIASVLAQTMDDFECIVLDDGSQDETLARLKTFSDPRLRIMESSENEGYSHRLRQGVAVACGQFIARLDADDRCHPDRFMQQVERFQEQSELVLLGTGCRLIDGAGQPVGEIRHPVTDRHLRWKLLLDNPFQHPSVMMRKAAMDSAGLNFDVTYEPAEDYALWSALARVGKIGNLPDLLIDYRVHEGQVSQSRRERQLENHDRVVAQNLSSLDGRWNEDALLRQTLREFEQGSVLDSTESKPAREVICQFIALWQQFEAHYSDPSPEVGEAVMKRLKRLWSKTGSLKVKLQVLVAIWSLKGGGIKDFFRA